MTVDNEAKGATGTQDNRAIDGYIQKAVDEGEIDPEALMSGRYSIFWDRNTIRAAVAGVFFLLCVNAVFYYSMRVDEADNTTQWELTKRDFLIEYRESRLARLNGTDSAPASMDDFQSTFKPAEQDIVVIETDSFEPEEYLATVNTVEPMYVEPMNEEPIDALISSEAEVEVSSSEVELLLLETAVRETIDAWAQAWSFQSVEDYLAFYSEDFVSQGGAPIGPWGELRADRVTKPDWVQVSVEDVRILIDGELAIAEFTQLYAASNYADDSQKTLVLHNEGGNWKILEETSAPLE